MIETFEDALMDLIDEWQKAMTNDEIISVMELRVMSMQEEAEDPS